MKQFKRFVAFSALLVMIFALAGCGNSAESNSEQSAAPTETQETQIAVNTEEKSREDAIEESTETENSQVNESGQNGSDILVVYFSRTGEQYTVGTIDKGNTAIVAEMIADTTGADMFEVLPQEDIYPYTYKELTDVAKQEQNDNARPAYQGNVTDLSKYSTVFIGAPVWWGDWPMIMYTFLENENLSGKTLIPFSTHEGSGLSGFDSKLASACPDSDVLAGLAIRGNDAQNNQESVRNTVNEWLSGLGY